VTEWRRSPAAVGLREHSEITGCAARFRQRRSDLFVSVGSLETTSSASGAASDATYTHAVPTTTSGGGTSSATLSDAFDGYGALVVNGTHFTHNGTATLTCNEREILFGTQMIGDLAVTRRVFVPDNDAFLR